MCMRSSGPLTDGEKVIFVRFPSCKGGRMESDNKYAMCRLCLHKSDGLVDIFHSNSRFGYAAAELITDLLRLQVDTTDLYPRVICSRCVEKLTEFKLFKDQCISSKAAYSNMYIHSCADLTIDQPLVKIEPVDISDEDISSQMSCRSGEVSGNEVSTTQCSKKRREETAQQRERRLERQRNYYNQRKQSESLETRQQRLSKMRQLAVQRREKESGEEREQRLAQLRTYAMRRIANESQEQREMRLKNMRLYAENRLANETLEQRQRRLGHSPFDSPEKKAPGVQKRKPYARRLSSSLPQCPAAQENTFEPLGRSYETQESFQEYLSHLGLGLVEQRVNQMQGQYPYGNPRIYFQDLATQDRLPAQFPQSQIVPFQNMQTAGQEEGIQPFGAHPEVVQSVQKPQQEAPFLPSSPVDGAKGTDVDGNVQQVPQQCPKKALEVKMYEIL